MNLYKYNPEDFPYPVNEDMRKVYSAYNNKSKIDLIYSVDDLFYSLKHLGRYNIISEEKMYEMQAYFRRLSCSI